jgi:hypothetical protein
MLWDGREWAWVKQLMCPAKASDSGAKQHRPKGLRSDGRAVWQSRYGRKAQNSTVAVKVSGEPWALPMAATSF